MREPGTLGTVKSETGWPQLADAAQTLKDGRINQSNQHCFHWIATI
jgi:hypothetical protein